MKKANKANSADAKSRAADQQRVCRACHITNGV